MIERIKPAWAAFCGATVLDADHWIAVATDKDGFVIQTNWRGLIVEDAGMALYRAADSIASQLPHRSLKVH